MNLHIVKTIFFKELKDTIRDSKTIIVMILLPIILYPLLAVGGGQILIQQGKMIQQNVADIYLNKKNNDLYNFLSKEKKIRLVETENPMEELRKGNINAIISVPEKFNSSFNNEKTIPIKIYYDQANIQSLNAYSKLAEIFKRYKSRVIEIRVKKRGLNKEIFIPVALEEKNIAPKEKIGGFLLGNMLPFLIIMMTILGAFYPAIDQTAGEKERGTLETLLTTPVKKHEIITGKFLTVSLFALITGMLNLGSMTLSMNLLLSSDKINFSIPWNSIGLIFIVLIPVTMFFVALMMLVSTLANSFKDAQNYLTPVYLICGFPAMVTVFPGFTLNYKMAFIPVANVSLLIKDLLLSKFEPDLIFVVIVVTTVYSVIAIAAATRLFDNEEILLSDESNLRLIFLNPDNRLNRVPNFLEAFTLYIITFGLLFYLGTPIQNTYRLNGLLFTEILLVLLPALLFTKYLKFDFKETFSIRKVSFKSVIASVLLAFSSGFFIFEYVDVIQNKFLPVPEELNKAFEFFLLEDGKMPGFFKLFFIISVSAAVCEEFLFRGPIMTGIRSKFGKKSTVLVVGIMFGIFHLNLYKLIPASVLGMIITYITLSTGSIFNGMIFHLVNNATAIILSGDKPGLLWFSGNTDWYYYPVFLICFIIGIYLTKQEEKGKL